MFGGTLDELRGCELLEGRLDRMTSLFSVERGVEPGMVDARGSSRGSKKGLDQKAPKAGLTSLVSRPDRAGDFDRDGSTIANHGDMR